MKRSNKFSNKKNSDYSMAHVLYQKLGNDWYAFTEMDGDCFMTKVDPETVEQQTINDKSFKHEPKRNKAA